jgi:hypothetical protein
MYIKGPRKKLRRKLVFSIFFMNVLTTTIAIGKINAQFCFADFYLEMKICWPDYEVFETCCHTRFHAVACSK